MGAHFCFEGARLPITYVVSCKRYARSIPAGTQEFPRINRVVQSTICGEMRRYRPSEVYLGFPDSRVIEQPISNTRRRKGGL